VTTTSSDCRAPLAFAGGRTGFTDAPPRCTCGSPRPYVSLPSPPPRASTFRFTHYLLRTMGMTPGGGSPRIYRLEPAERDGAGAPRARAPHLHLLSLADVHYTFRGARAGGRRCWRSASRSLAGLRPRQPSASFLPTTPPKPERMDLLHPCDERLFSGRRTGTAGRVHIPLKFCVHLPRRSAADVPSHHHALHPAVILA